MADQVAPNADGSTLKEQGNALFKSGAYEQACELYSQALQQGPQDATLLSNRAAAYLKLGEAGKALADADAAIQLRPKWEKGHYRRGIALEAQQKLEQALEAFGTALVLNPSSRELSDRVRDLGRKVRRAAKSAKAAAPKAHAFAREAQGPLRMSGPDAWAAGLPRAEQYEWLVDCYRMRIDDDYVWGGGNLHGLYSPEATRETVLEDFLVFCKLAARHGVVPAGWSWAAFLRTAAGLLPYAFEKSDAKEKWGGENIFQAMLGGRSLRATAEVVLGSSSMGGGGVSREAAKLHREVKGAARQLQQGADGSESEAMFGEVGGQAPWRELLSSLHLPAQNWG